jgi:hypothetical protein
MEMTCVLAQSRGLLTVPILCSVGSWEESAGRLQVRKLEDNYFKDWSAGTELGLEGFKQLMRIELRR